MKERKDRGEGEVKAANSQDLLSLDPYAPNQGTPDPCSLEPHDPDPNVSDPRSLTPHTIDPNPLGPHDPASHTIAPGPSGGRSFGRPASSPHDPAPHPLAPCSPDRRSRDLNASTSRALDRLAFHLLFLPASASARKAMERFGSVGAVLRARPAELDGLGLSADIISSIAGGECFERAARETELAARRGVAILTIDDPGYPDYLREIPGPPGALYCAGRLKSLRQPSVAVVGSRRPTHYGRTMAEDLARDLAARGVVIVSGLATGIDATAHWGALKEGETVAVLGSGLDVIYPRDNWGLAGKIMDRGAIVTEYPFGTRPERRNFPVRNRIISGLSLGVVVVEAARKSGSLFTAGFGLDQGREVMAVPGAVTSEMSLGTNDLLRDGAALIGGWEDVVEALPEPWRAKILAEKPRNVDNGQASYTDEEKNLLELIPSDGVIEADELLERTERSVPELLALLLELELKGAIIQRPGRLFQRRS